MYKLNKGQRLLLKMARKRMITKRILKDIQDIMEGKVPNPAKQIFHPIILVDDLYDGPEDKTEEIRINPDMKENKIAAYMIKKFGQPFGTIYHTYILIYGNYTKRSAGQFIRRLKELGSWKDVDFGDA